MASSVLSGLRTVRGADVVVVPCVSPICVTRSSGPA